MLGNRNLNSDAPYEWRKNDHRFLSTNERITVDVLSRLIFKNVTEEDEDIFTQVLICEYLFT